MKPVNQLIQSHTMPKVRSNNKKMNKIQTVGHSVDSPEEVQESVSLELPFKNRVKRNLLDEEKKEEKPREESPSKLSGALV